LAPVYEVCTVNVERQLAGGKQAPGSESRPKGCHWQARPGAIAGQGRRCSVERRLRRRRRARVRAGRRRTRSRTVGVTVQIYSVQQRALQWLDRPASWQPSPRVPARPSSGHHGRPHHWHLTRNFSPPKLWGCHAGMMLPENSYPSAICPFACSILLRTFYYLNVLKSRVISESCGVCGPLSSESLV
jgi:hypothetical protein